MTCHLTPAVFIMRNWHQGLIWLALGLLCLLVFMAYLNPHLILALGNRVWGCF